VPTFVAHVELWFEADSVEAAGRRLTELTSAARSVGSRAVELSPASCIHSELNVILGGWWRHRGSRIDPAAHASDRRRRHAGRESHAR